MVGLENVRKPISHMCRDTAPVAGVDIVNWGPQANIGTGPFIFAHIYLEQPWGSFFKKRDESEVGVGDMEKIYHIFFLSRFFVMLVLLFCKLSEQYSQTNFSIIKPFKVTKKQSKKKRMADI